MHSTALLQQSQAVMLPAPSSSGIFRSCQPPHGHRHCMLATATTQQPAQSGPRSRRLEQLAEIGLQDGWSVQPSTAQLAPDLQSVTQVEGADPGWGVSSSPATPAVIAKPARKQRQKSQLGETGTPMAGKGKAAPLRAPFMDIQSEQGVLGLALLTARLKQAEGSELTQGDMAAMAGRLDVASKSERPQGKLGSKTSMKAGVAAAVAVMGAAGAAKAPAVSTRVKYKKKKVVYVDDDDNIIGEEDEAEELSDIPAFSLTLGDDSVEFEEFDRQGRVVKHTSTPLLDAEEDEEPLAIEAPADVSPSTAVGVRSRQQLRSKLQAQQAEQQQLQQRKEEEEDDEVDFITQVPRSARDIEALLGGQGAAGAGALLGGQEQAEEEVEWGLEELGDGQQETLMEQLGVVKSKKSKAKKAAPLAPSSAKAGWRGGTMEGDGADVQWGGTQLNGMPPGADLGAQEALLTRMFKPHKVKELVDHQRAAYEAVVALRRTGSTHGKYGTESKLHRQLRLVGGAQANRRLLSSQGSQTRPMMEKVRAAIFNMILSQAGTTNNLPPNSRWLDLFAGTGSVGLEALSRGAATTHFVEMDPWVCRNILGANITSCGFNKQSVVHTGKAEQFLQRARQYPSFAGGAFDFISVCPPYLLVSYPELFQLLEGSPLLHPRTILFVEYPKQLSAEVPEQINNLEKVRDRKYGRTWVAVYAPPWAGLLRREVDEQPDQIEVEEDFDYE